MWATHTRTTGPFTPSFDDQPCVYEEGLYLTLDDTNPQALPFLAASCHLYQQFAAATAPGRDPHRILSHHLRSDGPWLSPRRSALHPVSHRTATAPHGKAWFCRWLHSERRSEFG